MSAETRPKTFADEAKFRVKLGLLFGIPLLAYGLFKGSGILAVIAIFFLVEALLFHFRMKLAAYLSILFFVIVTTHQSWLMATDAFTAMRAVIAGVCLFSIWGEWLNFGPVLRGLATWDDLSEPDEFELEDDDESSS